MVNVWPCALRRASASYLDCTMLVRRRYMMHGLKCVSVNESDLPHVHGRAASLADRDCIDGYVCVSGSLGCGN